MVDIIFLEEPKKFFFELNEKLVYSIPTLEIEINDIKKNIYNTEVIVEEIENFNENKFRKKIKRNKSGLF